MRRPGSEDPHRRERNSRTEWNLEYLEGLREKFLQQEYPLDLINKQFAKALSVDRSDLIFSNPSKKKQKRIIIAPLIITESPANPPYRKWIQEEIHILHKDPEMNKTFSLVSVVSRQNKNIGRRIIKTRLRKKEDNSDENNNQPAGNHQFHSARCVCCCRMENGQTQYRSTKTGRTYNIKRHYTCQTMYCVYLVTCGLCSAQYTGQTTRSMRDRHYGHRNEVINEEGLGAHFFHHAQDLHVDVQKNVDDIMKYFNLTVIASVEPNMPWSRDRLDNLESDMMERLMTMESYGGINLRIERRRGN